MVSWKIQESKKNVNDGELERRDQVIPTISMKGASRNVKLMLCIRLAKS